MDLSNIIRMIRKTWLIIIALALVGGATAAGVAAVTPRAYSATTLMYFGYSATAASTPGDLVQANNFAIQKVASYVQVATTPRVLDQVIADLQIDSTPDDLASQLEVTSEPNSVIISITAKDASPQDAATLSSVVASTFADVVVGELEAPVGGGASPVRAEILQDAVAPSADSPSDPNVLLYVAIGVFGGLLVGVLFALVLAVIDRRVHRRSDIEGIIERPAVAGVPKRTARGFDLAVAPDAATAEAVRMVRGSLELAAGDEKVLVTVTSPTAADRSEVLAASLARSFAEGGRSVLLLDGDVERSALSALLGIDGRPGLAELLTGGSAAPVASPVDRLELMPSGSGEVDLARQLAAPGFRALLQRMGERYDAVVIAAGPVLTEGDTPLFAAATRRALLVTALGTSTRDEVAASVAQLEAQPDVELGVVVTRVPSRGPDADAQSQALQQDARSKRARGR